MRDRWYVDWWRVGELDGYLDGGGRCSQVSSLSEWWSKLVALGVIQTAEELVERLVIVGDGVNNLLE